MSHISPELLKLMEPRVKRGEMTIDLNRPGYLLVTRTPDGDEYFIEPRPNEYALLMQGERRNSPDQVYMVSTHLGDLERYLAQPYLASMRETRYGWAMIPYEWFDEPKEIPGVEVISTIGSGKVWVSGIKRASMGDAYDANKLTYYMDASWEDLTASYADPDGQPLFPAEKGSPEDYLDQRNGLGN